ncbi:MAG TPA: hypothetical protein VJN68_10200, partial [Burkholderiaceae bacterium]|nr:hypothetical protein [Burkholderiaceae bacterium]
LGSRTLRVETASVPNLECEQRPRPAGTQREEDGMACGMSRARPIHAVAALLTVVSGACSSQATSYNRDGGDAETAGPIDSAGARDRALETIGDGSLDGCVDPLPTQPWPVMVVFDHSDCAARAASECTAGAYPTESIGSQLSDIAQGPCFLPTYTWVRVTFDGGCPASLSMKSIRDSIDPELVACLTEQLRMARWTCAETVTCMQIEFDTLP